MNHRSNQTAVICVFKVVLFFLLVAGYADSDVIYAQDSKNGNKEVPRLVTGSLSAKNPALPTGQKMNPSPLPPQWAPFAPTEYLESGWPVIGYQANTGSCVGAGPSIHVLVGNIDADPRLEVLVTSVDAGPLNAWHHDGTVVSGWPVSLNDEEALPALGYLSNNNWLDVIAGFPLGNSPSLAAFIGNGMFLPGWPISVSGIWNQPSLADVVGDSRFEIFSGENDGKMHAYDADANPLPGWPVDIPVGGYGVCHAPVFADLDGDTELEIITGDYNASANYLYVFSPDGSQVPWSPVQFRAEDIYRTYPVVGDVDGDSEFEIVVVGTHSTGGTDSSVYLFSNTGQLQREIKLNGTVWSSSTAPALADLDNDGFPEIIVQTNEGLHVLKGDSGAYFAGWPVTFPGKAFWEYTGPVVGDVDGDQKPEIVTVDRSIRASSEVSTLRIYETNGQLNKVMGVTELPIGSGGVSAIADIDLDGRNEIIVRSSNGYPAGFENLVWAFDLKGPKPHGPILWGQLGGNAAHQGVYPVPEL